MGASFSRAKGAIGSTFKQVKDAWLEMLLAGLVGYYLPSTLGSLGLGYAAMQYVPGYATFVDYMYNQTGQGNGPWGGTAAKAGGIVGIGKLAGAVDGSYTTLQAARHGGFKRGDLVRASFDLGLVLDGPGDSGGWGGVQNASGGYW